MPPWPTGAVRAPARRSSGGSVFPAQSDRIEWMEALLLLFAFSSPIWTPIVFIAFALGRQKFSLAFLFAFITAEAVSLAIFVTMVSHAIPRQ